LTGEKREIDLLANAVGFRYAWDPETAQYNHPAVLMTLAPGGAVTGYFDGLQPNPSALEAALERPGPTMAAATIEDVILNCFRFDSARSRYGSAIAWLLRAGAAGLLITVGALVWRVSRAAQRRTGVQP
jgi:protein SCO1/2